MEVAPPELLWEAREAPGSLSMERRGLSDHGPDLTSMTARLARIRAESRKQFLGVMRHNLH